MKRIGSKNEPGLGAAGHERAVHREHVLYVEDDDSNWRVAELRLSQGYDLLRASNSEQACRVIHQRGTELAAILMDIELRGSELNGVELTKLIRGKRSAVEVPAYARDLPTLLNTPIIFVTAHGAKYSDAQLLLAGGDKVIGKPVDFGALSVALTQLHLARRAARTRR
ncbi:MAG: Multi-sensor hybrid histidine kinase [Myxococcaceae bacterium]|nr:Multi-sensor hybrid histidine kinase [Myxococcaceae bacterium]